MRLAALLMSFLFAAGVDAAEINGKVTVLNQDGKPLKSFANTIVYLADVESLPPDAPAVMDQTEKAFVPRLLPVVRDQELLVLNSDGLQHNVYSPHEQEPFDLGTFPKGESRSIRLQVFGRHPLYCNIHKNMVSDIFVVPGVYFSLTDDKGSYRIENVPAGSFTLKVWNIFGGADDRRVAVSEGEVRTDFTVRSRQLVQQAPSPLSRVTRQSETEPVDGENTSGGE